MLHFAVFPKLRFRQIVGTIDAYCLETEGPEPQDCRAVHVALAAGEHCFDVRHDGFEILTLMQKHAIPVGNLVLPILLPLAECAFFQQSMGLDDELGSCSFKANAPFYTDDCVANVAVTPYGIGPTEGFYPLNGSYLVVELLIIHGHDFALFESYLQQTFLLLRDMFQVSLLGKALRWVE